MADDRRVEGRIGQVGSGYGATAERIAEIQQRAVQVEKLTRPRPSTAFSTLIQKKRDDSAKASPEEGLQEDEEKHPKSRIGMAHPSQRATYGRSDEAEPILIKG